MPLFIKTEHFTKQTLELPPNIRRKYLQEHKNWVDELRNSGRNLASGYLIDQKKLPGGGGFLVIEATSYNEAKNTLQKDPMINNGLVEWTLHEWVPISGELLALA